MSVKTDRYLECDRCGRQDRMGLQEYQGQTAYALRWLSEKDGWSNPTPHKDYCWRCTKKPINP